MLAAKVRMGTVEDQDRFRREDMLAMTPDERIMTLIRLRNTQFGLKSKADVLELLTRNPEADLGEIQSVCKRYQVAGLEAILRERDANQDSSV